MRATEPTAEDEGTGRERRCIVTGRSCSDDGLIRFVVGPDGEVVPDVEEKLPGRGLWVSAERAVLVRAAGGNAFAKAARAPVKAAADLPQRVEQRLAAHMAADLGLARRAGLLVCGFEKVMSALDGKTPPRLLVEARDGAADGRHKLAAAVAARRLAVDTVDCLSAAEMSLALGRENVIHAAVKPGLLADRLIRDGARLAGVRETTMDAAVGPNPAG